MAYFPNPFALPQHPLWQASFVSNDAGTQMGEAAFETLPNFLSSQRFLHDEANGLWRVDGCFDGEPDAGAMDIALTLALQAAGGAPKLEWHCAPLEQKNWVLEVEQRYPAMRLGRFFVYAAHHEGGIPAGMVGLRVDAGMAFGTGEHATTAGCLLALSRLHTAGLRPRRVLDMGCGSGILAMAAHKLWPTAQVLGVDIDPIAVKVAQENAGLNRCRPQLKYLAGDGYALADVGRMGPYDVIVANILARPLMAMAKDLRANLAPRGVGVLSGLLNSQEQMVLSAHRMQGLSLRHATRLRGWSALEIG